MAYRPPRRGFGGGAGAGGVPAELAAAGRAAAGPAEVPPAAAALVAPAGETATHIALVIATSQDMLRDIGGLLRAVGAAPAGGGGGGAGGPAIDPEDARRLFADDVDDWNGAAVRPAAGAGGAGRGVRAGPAVAAPLAAAGAGEPPAVYSTLCLHDLVDQRDGLDGDVDVAITWLEQLAVAALQSDGEAGKLRRVDHITWQPFDVGRMRAVRRSTATPVHTFVVPGVGDPRRDVTVQHLDALNQYVAAEPSLVRGYELCGRITLDDDAAAVELRLEPWHMLPLGSGIRLFVVPWTDDVVVHADAV